MNCHEINMMKSSDSFHQNLKRHSCNLLINPGKKPRKSVACSASIFVKPLGLPLISKTTKFSCDSLHLEPNKPYAIGRDSFSCDFFFNDKKISKTHCQILFDSSNKKVFLSDGVFFGFDQFGCSSRVRVSLNGVFVNGIRIGKREVVNLCVGDEVLLGCGNGYGSDCNLSNRVGFVVEKIVFLEEIVDRNVADMKANSELIDYDASRLESYKFDAKAGFLLSLCRDILCSNDPVSLIKRFAIFDGEKCGKYARRSKEKKFFGFFQSNDVKLDTEDQVYKKEVLLCDGLPNRGDLVANCHGQTTVASERKSESQRVSINGNAEELIDKSSLLHENGANANSKPKTLSLECPRMEGKTLCDNGLQDKREVAYVPPPGRKFYLNRLQSMGHCSTEAHDVVSLPELFYPVESLQRVFIATFTNDIPWFLSYCEIPAHLPITIACHNAERCWSSNPDERTSMPYSDFPQLIIVYPLFPEAIAFGKDRKKSGIACHHPKLFALQREDSLRVVITSANLVASQWHNVTNTVWFQDFPRSSAPDYLSLFPSSSGEKNHDSKSDFGAQLAGFMASLVIDVPSQAHWILELAKYSFKGALVHLIASVPGIYSPRSPYMSQSRYYMFGNQNKLKLSGANLLGCVETSVVGLSHLFRTSADTSGIKLKKLAMFLGMCCENEYGMSEVLLRRESNIPVDGNAVSVFIPNPEEFSLGDCIQVGFLPRDIAKWVAPLSDDGFFAFSAYIYPKEVLRAALEGTSTKVQLMLYVSQGPCFSGISKFTRCQHFSALCSLVASIQRCVGLWRLQEVLSPYKWPENSETDFIFGSSSIGAVNAQFLAAFSAAAGKRAVQLSESEESDPHWGCWSASQELRNPSIKIIFPTIERVKSAGCGILASKYILCFSQKTWQRLKNVGILHDAIPYPNERVGFPMHVKVARRRFQSRTDASSFGWVYCGSHNFSAAAWGRPLSNTVDRKANVNDGSPVLSSRLHICNYELGIIFTVPPSDGKGHGDEKFRSLDDIVLPFVTPAPKYRPRDGPATAQAMREVLTELTKLERNTDEAVIVTGESPDEEEEIPEAVDFVTKEKEDEKAYAEKLWSQVDSSNSC